MNYRHLLTAVGAVLLLSASEAQATAILTLGNVPQPDENVLLNTGLTGNPIFGTTNQTGLAVRFTGVETLTAPANGQARIDASDDFFTYLMIDVPNGTFESLIVNPDATADGTIDFRVTTNTGVQLFNDVVLVGNGNNFFTITTDAAQSLVSVEFLADVDLADTSQVRLGGAQLVSVPDPASTFSLLGFGLVGLAAARRRFARK